MQQEGFFLKETWLWSLKAKEQRPFLTDQHAEMSNRHAKRHGIAVAS